MVKISRVLDDALAEAKVPYEETRLARRAARARPRLALLLLAGAFALAVEALLLPAPLLGVLAVAVALVAWRAWRGTLGGVVGAALVAVLAALVPLALLFVGERGAGEMVAMLAAVAWGVAMIPDALALIRDAELQHAYGRWARRE